MQDRGFNEAELREMIEDARGIEKQDHGTFVVETQ
jgi:hypothetical protein